MKPWRLVATRLAITAPGMGVVPAGSGEGNGVSIQSPPLPETNCAGCGVEKLTTSNRCTCPARSALTPGGNSTVGCSDPSTDCSAPLPGTGLAGRAGLGANASIGWWFMKNVLGRRAVRANARSSCPRYRTCIGSLAGNGAIPTRDESNTMSWVSASAADPSGTA
jgi:hypothetical protein